MATNQKQFRKRDIAYATGLVRQVCEIAGQINLIEDTRASFKEIGLLRAIQRHDDDALYNWLAEAISYQGISDQIAADYLARHGSIDAADVRAGLAQPSLCPKLTSHWHFEDCGYRKSAHTCNEPKQIGRCPLPKHDLRNGTLNRAAYSLHFFMRDIAGGDLVAWIDQRLMQADAPDAGDRAQRLREAVIIPLRHVYGISDKLLNMTLASLLLAGDRKRERWVTAGGSMIAIDSLVHNWMHRSGTLARLRADHLYGPGCYGLRGCAVIIEAVAKNIDAREFNMAFPATFPRFVQKAIWSFCAGTQLGQCNGNRIDDKDRCDESDCPLYRSCARVALSPRPVTADVVPNA